MDRIRSWFGSRAGPAQPNAGDKTTVLDLNSTESKPAVQDASTSSAAAEAAMQAAAATIAAAAADQAASSSDSSGRSASDPSGSGEASTSQSDEPEDVNPMLQTSLTKRFKGRFQPLQMPTYESMMQEDFMNNCLVRSCIAGGMGGLLGVAFGVFTASLDTQGIDAAPMGETKPTRVVLRETWQLMKEKSRSYAKGFAGMGLLYSGTECMIERYRAKHDSMNATLAGCATGGLMAAPGGAKAMCFGCASFAAFSTAIEYFTGGL